MKSWKTTAAGILIAIAAIATAAGALLDGDPATTVDMELLLTAVMGGLAAAGLIAARDNDKTSEDTGAKEVSRKRQHLRLPLVLLCAGLAAMAGCNTLGMPGAQSQAIIKVDETTTNEYGTQDKFKLDFRGKGDAEELLQGLNYRGEADGSWELTVDQNVAGLTSPGNLAMAEGYAELVRVAPDIAQAILPYLNQPEAPSALQSLLQLVTSVVLPP
jgi:hypothetical protein